MESKWVLEIWGRMAELTIYIGVDGWGELAAQMPSKALSRRYRKMASGNEKD